MMKSRIKEKRKSTMLMLRLCTSVLLVPKECSDPLMERNAWANYHNYWLNLQIDMKLIRVCVVGAKKRCEYLRLDV